MSVWLMDKVVFEVHEGQEGLLNITILAYSLIDPSIVEIDGLGWGHKKEGIMLYGRKPLPHFHNVILCVVWLCGHLSYVAVVFYLFYFSASLIIL